jgi:hypothetical protein
MPTRVSPELHYELAAEKSASEVVKAPTPASAAPPARPAVAAATPRISREETSAEIGKKDSKENRSKLAEATPTITVPVKMAEPSVDRPSVRPSGPFEVTHQQRIAAKAA